MAYQLLVTEGVIDFIEQNVWSKRVYDRILECEEIAAQYPEAAPEYDPTYPAARPPFSCRRMVIPNTPFVFFYLIDDEAETVTVFSIQYAAGDPRKRFWDQ